MLDPRSDRLPQSDLSALWETVIGTLKTFLDGQADTEVAQSDSDDASNVWLEHFVRGHAVGRDRSALLLWSLVRQHVASGRQRGTPVVCLGSKPNACRHLGTNNHFERGDKLTKAGKIDDLSKSHTVTPATIESASARICRTQTRLKTKPTQKCDSFTASDGQLRRCRRAGDGLSRAGMAA